MGTNRMSLVCFLILALLGTGANMESMLTQLVPSNTKRSGNTAFLECRVNVTPFGYAYIHWYRQKPGGPPERILYLSSNENVIHENGISEERYEAKKRESDLSASLRIHQVTEADAGLYYCDQCDSSSWIKNFAEGTQLIVLGSDSPNKKKAPKPIFFLPALEEVKQKRSGTYICLLEDFFPNVVKTYWKDENSRPLDAQLGPVTSINGSYSQVSWLTVQEDSLPKNLTYFFQHEEVGIEPMAVPLPSIWEAFKKDLPSVSCEKTEVKNKGLQELHFANTSAFYTYTILLVKSTIYFTITLFFLYQKRVAGSQGTK
ncbi:T-cell receptor gamma alternate reading frame protein [Petaurus breviceps papuanus]|uniref:T-cell receptor gamma alternate reading frame protein n=1 Tax=Petaurus breviceps papuanus TaxID=3040969 RepID=UPI0036DC00FF